ncbi:MAG TPA: hypothetical protein VMV68_04670 [Spirochaetia bacterium]|nr:hypothetical protein [Spirochaetia bacterium]
MVYEPHDFWSDEDLAYVLRVLLPDSADRSRMIPVLREDRTILDAMLNDDRLFRKLMESPDGIVNVSARLFFTVLLYRTRSDLEKQTFTFERDNRYSVVIFDSSAVLSLLKDPAILAYLAAMLASFARIESRTLFVRAKSGVLRRVRVNDFDIESLIEHSRLVGEEQQALVWKRIGDICLFLLGVFSDHLEVERRLPGGWYRTKSKEELVECGSYYYRAAARRGQSLPRGTEYAMARVSEEFLLATKPLTYLSSRYLGFVKRTVFLQ